MDCGVHRSLVQAASSLISRTEAPSKLVRVDDRAQHDAAFFGAGVAGAAVHRRDLVPDHHVADLPGVIIDEPVLGRVIAQFLDQLRCIVIIHPDKAVAVRRVDEEHVAARDRVLSHRRMQSIEPPPVAVANVFLAVKF